MPQELTDKLYETLRKYWGHTQFRPMQLETMLSVCAGRDTFSLMPTGAAAIFGPGTPVSAAAIKILELLLDE